MLEVSTATKLAMVLRYLELGGEWKYKGHTIVWLDNHVTSTLPNGDTYGIHGLARKGVSINGDVETPCYMGLAHDFNAIVQMVDEISEADYVNMVVSVALKESVAERRCSKE